jgi:hypothetical protein
MVLIKNALNPKMCGQNFIVIKLTFPIYLKKFIESEGYFNSKNVTIIKI